MYDVCNAKRARSYLPSIHPYIYPSPSLRVNCSLFLLLSEIILDSTRPPDLSKGPKRYIYLPSLHYPIYSGLLVTKAQSPEHRAPRGAIDSGLSSDLCTCLVWPCSKQGAPNCWNFGITAPRLDPNCVARDEVQVAYFQHLPPQLLMLLKTSSLELHGWLYSMHYIGLRFTRSDTAARAGVHIPSCLLAHFHVCKM